MIYNDGFTMDENIRVTKCPQCSNEEFSSEAAFCRICGSPLYNSCEGEDIFDYSGNFDHREIHNNPGNARFCETCGKPTSFFKLKYLKPFNEFQSDSVSRFLEQDTSSATNSIAVTTNTPALEEDELPF